MLGKAKKPLFLVGGGVNIARAGEVFTEIVDRTKVPVVTTVMGRGAIPTNHPLYIGNLGMILLLLTINKVRQAMII